MSMRPLGKLKKDGPKFKLRQGRERVEVTHRVPDGTSPVQQSAKQQCDVNLIIKNHTQGLPVQHLNRREPLHGDFTGVTDLLGAIEQVEQAYELFHALPSAVRKAAHNDPVVFLDMYSDDDGREQLVQAGLLTNDEPSTGRQGPTEETPAETTTAEQPADTKTEESAAEGKTTQEQ